MEKDRIPKVIKKIFHPFAVLFNKIVAQIHFLDPRENTKQRIISATILVPIALIAIFYSKDLFMFIAIAIAIMMTAEWLDISKNQVDQKKWRIIGFFYILIPIYSVIKLRFYSSEVLFWMFAVIWSTDIFAFFAGKMLGGVKLAPSISPNKTWSGMVGGIIASMIIGFMSSFMFAGGVMFFIFLSAFLSIVEQISDLVESKFKRIFGVKDSGNIIPGHGGVLDRMDGMMLLAPLVLFLVTIFPARF
ncbi:phosphatidate cytidylyltransferase [Alphaproteobacteria bacterium]|nr:phosphatidate cytidylyltransferase [Alphaproteobacteria bacterium]